VSVRRSPISTSTDATALAASCTNGATTAFVYDDRRRRVVAWLDSNASRYDYLYDDHDRVVAEGGEAGHVRITLAYTEPDPETGHRSTTLTTADGHATRHLFGPGCRLLAVTDPLGHTTRFTYDARGNLLTRTDPLGLTTTFAYDQDGRAVSATRPDGSELRTVRGPYGRQWRSSGRTAPARSMHSTNAATAQRSPTRPAPPPATPTTTPAGSPRSPTPSAPPHAWCPTRQGCPWK